MHLSETLYGIILAGIVWILRVIILDDILNDCSSGKSSPMCSLFYTEKTSIFEYPIPLSEYELSNQPIEKPVVKKVITRSFFDSSKPIIKPTEKPITVIQRVKRMMGLDKNSDRRVKYSYPIYINSMNDTNLDIPIFQYNPNWYEDYQKKMESIKADYTGKVPEYYEMGLRNHDDKYSSFIRNLPDGGGYTFVYGKNICYNTKRHMYVFLMKDRKLSLQRLGWGDAFTYGWRWYNMKNTTDDINALWIDKPSYITQPYTIHHIYHFVESINFLWTKLLLPYLFPPLEMLWLPRFNTETDYPWAVEYAKVLQNAFKDYHVQVINSADIQQLLAHSSSPLICFRRVVLLDRSHYNGAGGSISGWEPADLLRVNFYKYADFTLPQHQDHDIYQLHLIQREGPRHILRSSLLISNINKHFHNRVNATLMYSNCSLACQIHMFAKADIIMTPHGAGQTNIVFMRPRTVFLETFPPFFYECTFMDLANIVRVHYISITTYNETYLDPHAQIGSAQRYYEKGIFIQKRKHYIRTLIDPNHFSVIAAVDSAVEYLNSYRYKRMEFYDNFLF